MSGLANAQEIQTRLQAHLNSKQVLVTDESADSTARQDSLFRR